MRTRHYGDCPIYASVASNFSPEVGICCCGYGWYLVGKGDWSEMYSKELLEKLETPNKETLEALEELEKGGGHAVSDVDELFKELNDD